MPEMIRMIRAALYIRVSTEEQALHGYSIEAQKQALTEYVQKNNMHIVDYYTDEGQSARKAYSKRREFIRLMDDVKAGKIDIILFVKLDRWFRSIRDYYRIQDILEQHNVNWKTIFENYDTSTAAGRLYINIMLSVAQDEADRTSERIKFVFANKVKTGEVLSGKVAYGYRIENKKLVVDPNQAEVVKEIFTYFLHRQSKKATLIHIQEKYGIPILFATITRILSKRIYIGEYRNIKNFCEPIVDRELFEEVQKALKSNIRVLKTRVIFVYTGLLRCPICGRILSGSKTLKQGKTYLYYRCNRHHQDKLCTFNLSIRETRVDTYLVNNIKQQIKNYIADYEIKQTTAKMNSQTAERDKLRHKLEKLKELYLDDIIDKTIYKRDYEELTARLNSLDEIKILSKKINIKALQEFLTKDISKIYEALTPTEKRTLWRSIIMEIHFNKDLEPIIFFS